jgi:tRNA(adenine34) deaminase
MTGGAGALGGSGDPLALAAIFDAEAAVGSDFHPVARVFGGFASHREGDEALIVLALQEAVLALPDDVPIGAVVLAPDGAELLGRGHNERGRSSDPTAHAEIVALREAAGRLGTWNLAGTTVAVTVEPCTMCAGAIVAARVQRLVFGCWEPKTGAVGSLWDVVRDRRLAHRVEVVGGVLADRCAAPLEAFFAGRR